MSSNLNILKNKKWHVWKFENIAKTERDEEEDERKKSTETKRSLELAAEDRYARLKRKNRRNSTSSAFDTSSLDSRNPSNPSSSNINLVSSLDSDQLRVTRNKYSSKKQNPSLVQQLEKKKNQDQKNTKKRKIISRFDKISSSLNDISEFTKSQKKKRRKRKRKRSDNENKISEYEPYEKKRKVGEIENIQIQHLNYIYPQPLKSTENQKKVKFKDANSINNLTCESKDEDISYEKLREERREREKREKRRRRKFLNDCL